MAIEEAALGILAVTVHNMVNAIETNSVRKGYDPREFALVAAGGAGPLVAADIALAMGIPSVVVPPHPGVTAAAGLLASDVRYELAVTVWQDLGALDPERVQGAFAELQERARERLAAAGVPAERMELEWATDCRYAGQGYELRTAAPTGEPDAAWAAAVREAFEARHEREYFGKFSDLPVQLVNVRVTGIGRMPTLKWPTLDAGGATAPVAEEPVVFGGERVPTNIYERAQLRAGEELAGPAIIEQPDSTTVVPPGARARIDEIGNIVLRFEEGAK